MKLLHRLLLSASSSGFSSGAFALGGAETNVLAMDFTDSSLLIKDTTTPANNALSSGRVVDGALTGPGSKLTYTAPSLKLTLQSDGYYKYQPHNLSTRSEDVTNGWTALGSTKSGDDTFYEAATTAQHAIYQTINPNIVGASYVFQVEVKGIGRTEVALSINDTNAEYSYFTISGAGSVGTTAANNVESTIEALADGWYRIKIRKVSKNLTMFPAVYGSVSGNVVYLGDVTKGYMVRKMQRNRYPVTTDYIKTTTVAKYGLPYSWDSSGVAQGILLEEARTNLLLWSFGIDSASWTKGGVTVSPNQAAGPFQDLRFDQLIEDTSTGDHRVYQGTGTLTSGETYTLSCIAKANGRTQIDLFHGVAPTVDARFDLSTGAVVSTTSGTASIDDLGDGFYRCSVYSTLSSTASTNAQVRLINSTTSYTGDGASGIYLGGVQLELGAGVTSPIETYGSTVTRAADILTVPTSLFSVGAANTLFTEFTPDRTDSFHALVGVHETGGLTDRYDLAISGDTGRFTVADGGVTQADITENGISAGTTYKFAARGEENLTRHCLSTTLSTQDTVCTMPAAADLDVLDIGHRDTGGVFTGVIRKVMIAPRGWSDAEMQTLTT